MDVKPLKHDYEMSHVKDKNHYMFERVGDNITSAWVHLYQ